MSTIQLLDVSLRDGGHRNDFHFQDQQIEKILKPLDNSGLEYIEIGYRKGCLVSEEKLGKAALCKKDYLLFCQSLIKNAKIAVMALPQNVSQADLQELKECGVSLLRLCVAKNEIERAFPTLALAKEFGLESAINLIQISNYSEKELDEAIETISKSHPDMIYFADSNGSMLPEKIQTIYERYTKRFEFPFGFHAHDNLGLAQTNAIAALNNGAQFIDVSLAGMGKGIGNLKTEFFAAYLHAIDIKKYRLPEILTAANFVRRVLGIGQEEIQLDEFIRAITNLSATEYKSYKNGLL